MAHNDPLFASTEHHSALESSGYSQSRYATCPNEPLVGQNRALEVIERQAQEFLLDLLQAGFFPSDDAFQERLQSVLLEIWGTSVPSVTEGMGVVGGTWMQTREELEVGVRRAWGDAGGCVMRSLCDELRLCDLRSVTRSTEMATELVKGLTEAYNGGDIIPTVFVFPPRAPNTTGPAIWNDRLLSFAGYELPDGTVLGDPANTHLTTAILALGWVPPEPKTRWDVLPLVVSSSSPSSFSSSSPSPSSSSPSDDKPALIELPAPLRTPIQIHHPNPKHAAAFAALDLRWTGFDAPGRLGVEIGGVGYTAAPFVGWFMDSEIGGALADPGRYDVLPGVIKALDLDTESILFEDLPKYEQLAIMSRAQVELTYAIHHSFLRAGVTIADPLSASKRWARYVGEAEKKNSDPARSQGSGSGVGIAGWYTPGEGRGQGPRIARCAVDPVGVWRSRAEGLAPEDTRHDGVHSCDDDPSSEAPPRSQAPPEGTSSVPPTQDPTLTPPPPADDTSPSDSRETPMDRAVVLLIDTTRLPFSSSFSSDPDPDPFSRRDTSTMGGALSVRLVEGEPDLDLDLDLDLELSPLTAAENPLCGPLGVGRGGESGGGWGDLGVRRVGFGSSLGVGCGGGCLAPRSRFLSTIEEEEEGEGDCDEEEREIEG